jgi:hypothetical protein
MDCKSMVHPQQIHFKVRRVQGRQESNCTEEESSCSDS